MKKTGTILWPSMTVIVVLIGLLAQPAKADLITVSAVRASDSNLSLRGSANVIAGTANVIGGNSTLGLRNQTGMLNDPGAWEAQGGSTSSGGNWNWSADARSPLPAVGDNWIAFDLGSVETLESMNVFNYGVNSNTGANKRGVNQGDIYYRSDGWGNNTDNSNLAFDNSGWTLLGTAGTQTFAIGVKDGSWYGATNVTLGGINARYFAIDINTSHGEDRFVGLNEVQFFSAAVVPEPSSFGLIGLSLAGFGWLLRRRKQKAIPAIQED